MIHADSEVVSAIRPIIAKAKSIALPMLEALIGQQPAQDRVRGRVEKGADALAGFTPKRQCFSPSRRPIVDPRCRSAAAEPRAAPSISSAANLWKSPLGAADQALFLPSFASLTAA